MKETKKKIKYWRKIKWKARVKRSKFKSLQESEGNERGLESTKSHMNVNIEATSPLYG